MLEFLLGLSAIFAYFGITDAIDDKVAEDRKQPDTLGSDDRTFKQKQKDGDVRSRPAKRKH